MNCLIVDDEQLARDMLASYAKKVPALTVIGKCKNTTDAKKVLLQKNVDLLLLDINMPLMTGIDLLRQLTAPPMVIFTTAYSEYSLEGFELEAIDYLLKPIGFERFLKAINRANALFSNAQKAMALDSQQNFDNQSILIKEGYNHHNIYLKDIDYVMAMREYAQYHTSKGKIMELRSLTAIDKILPSEYFIRIHRSYLVAKSRVIGHEQNILLLKGNLSLPIGKTYKKRVLQELFSF